MKMLLLQYVILNSRFSQKYAAEADILVAGVGRAKMVNADFVKEGAVVIDVGINVDEDGGIYAEMLIQMMYKKSINDNSSSSRGRFSYNIYTC